MPDVLAQDVNIPLPGAPGEADITNWVIGHADIVAAVVVALTLIAMWRSKYKPILIIIGTILATVVVLRMRG